jgi:xylulokinase
VDDATLGIDVGLTGARAAVLAREGQVLGHGRVPCRDMRFSPGRAEHDPAEWVAEATGAARAAMDSAGVTSVDAITVTALGPAPLLVDRELVPLTPALILSLDRRAEPIRRRLRNELGLGEADLSSDHCVPKLLWWREHAPEIWSRAFLAMDATGFIVASLTGNPVMDTITACDYRAPGLTSPVAVPDPREPLAIGGGLSVAAAAALGLPVGTPVTVGTYDSGIDLDRLGARAPGGAVILMGSTLIVAQVVEAGFSGPQDPGLRTTRLAGGDLAVGGWTSTAGMALDWCAAMLGLPPGEPPPEVAMLNPGAGGLLALPYLAGERSPQWDPLARGGIVGLTLGTTAAEVYRSVLDAVALSARDLTDRMAGEVPRPNRWRVGGGAVRNGAWLQATCDAVGKPFDVVDEPGGVAAAAFAQSARGQEPAPPATRPLVANMERNARFTTLFTMYRALYPPLAETMHLLARLDNEGDA